ncbi:ABC transporter B family protein [Heterostelium album PN500]|uniref:ABC transporter B family protein n=1 Tax=Heterostelium pallidum (strain ATCC 26659 / Pp 5 / PN500) TaxID=670386 RepID=D3BBJ2_HETP5|nr:ABC transporter B family protein [Heterostelium album PN500]EFA81025.1 ABC transporter B family protein [Heterostelium album PN500]|eukprot:XP_020433143.1 ABC transporter B family protein [Heterostelium album PN500]
MSDLLNRWNRAVTELVGVYARVSIVSGSPKRITVSLQCERAGCNILKTERLVYNWIAEQLESHTIEKLGQVVLANKFAPPIMLATSTGANLPLNDYTRVPIKGDGQIVGIADTGLDMSHCFFNDPNTPTPYNTINKNHRKVIAYYYNSSEGDQFDVVQGHGTHVAGSVAGMTIDASQPVAQFRGTAYNAKIAFVDISINGTNPEPGDLISMYQKVYDTGARVHSDSWGSHSSTGWDALYGLPSREIDEFVWSHPDMLIVRAAGNDGQSAYLSLLTQAVAKNCLTVGAQQSSTDSFKVTPDYIPNDATIQSIISSTCLIDPTTCNFTSADCCAKQATNKFYAVCCSPSMTQATRNTTSNTALYNQNNIASFSSKGPTHDSRVKPDIVAPGQFIISSMSNGQNNTNQCGATGALSTDSLLALEGTSMATPHVAGAATLLRQYLVEGYFPYGTPNTSNSINPSASLLKAILINSASQLNGTMVTPDNKISPIPVNPPFPGASYVSGWGAIKLGNFFNFQSNGAPAAANPTQFFIGGFDNSNPENPVFKEQLFVQNNTYNASYCIRYSDNSGVPNSGSIKATLVWSDMPAFQGAVYDLVNDLDLEMILDSTYTLGNQQPSSTGGPSPPDRRNNVEQIQAPATDGVTYKFTVLSTTLISKEQPYSIVISGTGPGKFQWAEQCPECGSTDMIVCLVPNGVGQKKCQKNLMWGSCIVSSCNSGFSYNSLTGSCSAFLNYNYIVIIVAGATMALLLFIVGLIKYKEYKDKKKYGADAKNSLGLSITPKPKDAKVSIPELYSFVHPFILRLVFSAGCSLIATAANILQPYYIGIIIQDIPTTKSITDLTTQFIVIFLLAFIEFLFTTISSWVSGIVSELMIMSIQGKIFKAIMAQDMGFFHKNNTPTLINVLIVDAPMLRSAVAGILMTFATSTCKFVGSLVFLFTISWKLSLAFFATVPVLVIVTKVQSSFTKKLTRLLLFNNSKASQCASEAMVNIQVVTTYCKQEREIERYIEHLQSVFATARRLIITNTFAASIKWLMVESLAFTVLYYGAYLSINGEFSVGLLISFSLYVGYVVDSSSSIFGIYVSYVQSLASAHRVFLILRSAPRKRTTLEEEVAEREALKRALKDNEKDKDNNNDNNNNNNNNDDNNNNNNNNNDNSISVTEPNNNNNNNNDLDGQTTNNNNNNNIVGDSPTGVDSENNNNNNNNEEESEAKKQKRLKKEEKKKADAFMSENGISVCEMTTLPSTFVDLDDVQGEIEFKSVSFKYPTRPDIEVLHNISFKLETGKCYGLVGPSGSGKSTCLELMAKFYQLKEGAIFLDGIDITKIRPSNLRSFVTVVHQHPYLFDKTIAQNIGYALDNPTTEEIIEAAKMANAHDFIMELPNQYDTQLGQAGNQLSGGQKKRIAVARAICSKRKIMLLDEITAELDPESEEAITNSIKKLTHGHTVVMVAHKIAAVKDCDKIFVLEKGYLVEEGNHNELMDKRGRYYKLFSNRVEEDDMDLPLTIS